MNKLMREIRQLACIPIPVSVTDEELFYHLFVWQDEDFYDEDWRKHFAYARKERDYYGDETVGRVYTVIGIELPETATSRYFKGSWTERRRTGVDEDSFLIVEVRQVVTTVYQNI